MKDKYRLNCILWGQTLTSSVLYKARSTRKAVSTLSDPSYSLACQHRLLPSGHRCMRPKVKKNRLKNFSVSATLGLINRLPWLPPKTLVHCVCYCCVCGEYVCGLFWFIFQAVQQIAPNRHNKDYYVLNEPNVKICIQKQPDNTS